MAFTEEQAKATFVMAIESGQCAEILNTLVTGGGFTYDQQTGRFIMITPAMIEEILEGANTTND